MPPPSIRLPRTLRTASFRLAALYALLFAASACVLGSVVFWTARQAMRQQMTLRIEAESALLQAEYRTDGPSGLIDAVNDRNHGAAALFYLVRGPDGTRLAGDLPAAGNRAGWLAIQRGVQQFRALAVDLGSGYALVVGDNLGRVGELEEAILRAFAWGVGATVLLGILGGILLSRAFLHRVDTIVRTAEAIIDGDLARRVPLRGTGDDLDHLAATLNRMLDRIAVLMDSLRQVSTDIAHDLRTPLSRLLHRLEDARSRGGTIGEYEAAIEAATGEAQGMLETFAALLRIAQIEGGERRARFRQVDLAQVAETVTEAFRPSAEDEGHDMMADIDPGVAVRGDRELLTQLLVNVVENALRHTPAGTRIDVSLCRIADGGSELAVCDDGPGVPDTDRPRILERFYRCEQSRTTAGNGLGLSLVAAIAELHGADLHIEDAAPGLRVRVTFPAMA